MFGVQRVHKQLVYSLDCTCMHCGERPTSCCCCCCYITLPLPSRRKQIGAASVLLQLQKITFLRLRCGAALTSGLRLRGAISLVMCSAAADLATRKAPAATNQATQARQQHRPLRHMVRIHHITACLILGGVAGMLVSGPTHGCMAQKSYRATMV